LVLVTRDRSSKVGSILGFVFLWDRKAGANVIDLWGWRNNGLWYWGRERRKNKITILGVHRVSKFEIWEYNLYRTSFL
jgi:hypothetical protein